MPEIFAKDFIFYLSKFVKFNYHSNVHFKMFFFSYEHRYSTRVYSLVLCNNELSKIDAN